ncbi:MAG: lipase family protein [Mariprofundales bacterium]
MAKKQEERQDFKIHSKLDSHIEQLSEYRKSLLFAELSAVAYMSKKRATLEVAKLGLTQVRFIDKDGAQAYIFENDYDCIVACRGTEPTQLNDIEADLKAVLVVSETVGHVHYGFKREIDDLWPVLEEALNNNKKELYFCGHSLGAAMATICASRCRLSYIKTNPLELFTYGSPRVGNAKYTTHCIIKHTRWVNNNDIVTRVPPALLGYRHVGNEHYLDAYGKLSTVTGWQRIKDMLIGVFIGLKHGNIDNFSDHLITNYIEYINQIVIDNKA